MPILAWNHMAAPVLLAAFLPLGAAVASAESHPERLVLYFNEDNDRVRQAITKLEASLRETGVAGRHRIRLKHVVVDISNLTETGAATIRESLAAHPAVLITPNSETADSARRSTAKVPIVFASYQDPVAVGLIKSLARPGGNTTGFTFFVPVDQKRMELLRQVVPDARRLGILIDRYWYRETGSREILNQARAAHGFEAELFSAETLSQLESVLASPSGRKMDAWYVPYTTLPFEQPDAVVRVFNRLGKPVVYSHTRFVERGGLLSYQPEMTIDEVLRLWATMIGLILDGVPAGEIPIERPKSFELAVNLDTARRLGITLPTAFLKRADRVVTGSGKQP